MSQLEHHYCPASPGRRGLPVGDGEQLDGHRLAEAHSAESDRAAARVDGSLAPAPRRTIAVRFPLEIQNGRPQPIRGGSNTAGTPIAIPADESDLQTDDQARRDGGKTTENKPVSKEQMEQIEEKALDHTKDEPGS